MINILFVIDTLYGKSGGTEKQLIEMLIRLDRKRFSPHLLCLRSSRFIELEQLPCPLTIFNLNTFLSTDFFKFGSLFKNLCREKKIHIVQSFFRDSNLAATLWAKKAKVPVIICSRRNIGTGYWHNFFEILILRYLRRFVTHYIANSKAAAQEVELVEKVDKNKISTFYNGLENNLYAPIDKKMKHEIRTRWGIPTNNMVIGTVANLRPIKNLHFIITAASALKEDCPNVSWVIIGEGDQRSELELMIKTHNLDNTVFLPGQSETVSSDLFAFDIAVHCSKGESFSNAIMEYMAARLPIIAADVGGTAEMISDNENGLLYTPEEQAEFQSKVKKLLSNSDLRTQLSLKAKADALRCYSFETSMRVHEMLYEKLHLSSCRPSNFPSITKQFGSGTPINNFILLTGSLFGMNALFRLISRHKLRILMYHGVTVAKTTHDCWTQIESSVFIKHIDYLKKNYSIISPETLSTSLDPLSLPPHPAIITFDDGFHNTYTTAWPLLKERGLPCICFVSTGLSEKKELIWTDTLYKHIMAYQKPQLDLSTLGLPLYNLENNYTFKLKALEHLKQTLKRGSFSRIESVLQILSRESNEEVVSRHPEFELMSPAQIKELAESDNFSIGLHTHTHTIMSNQSRADQHTEIKLALAFFKQWNIPYSPLFAYPNGRPQDYTDETIAILRENNFLAGFTSTDNLHTINKDQYRIPRINIGADTSFTEFKARLSGFYYFYISLKATFINLFRF